MIALYVAVAILFLLDMWLSRSNEKYRKVICDLRETDANRINGINRLQLDYACLYPCFCRLVRAALRSEGTFFNPSVTDRAEKEIFEAYKAREDAVHREARIETSKNNYRSSLDNIEAILSDAPMPHEIVRNHPAVDRAQAAQDCVTEIAKIIGFEDPHGVKSNVIVDKVRELRRLPQQVLDAAGKTVDQITKDLGAAGKKLEADLADERNISRFLRGELVAAAMAAEGKCPTRSADEHEAVTAARDLRTKYEKLATHDACQMEKASYLDKECQRVTKIATVRDAKIVQLREENDLIEGSLRAARQEIERRGAVLRDVKVFLADGPYDTDAYITRAGALGGLVADALGQEAVIPLKWYANDEPLDDLAKKCFDEMPSESPSGCCSIKTIGAKLPGALQGTLAEAARKLREKSIAVVSPCMTKAIEEDWMSIRQSLVKHGLWNSRSRHTETRIDLYPNTNLCRRAGDKEIIARDLRRKVEQEAAMENF